MTLTRKDLLQRLRQMDSRTPAYAMDMNAFFLDFEEDGGKPAAPASEDRAYVETELLRFIPAR